MILWKGMTLILYIVLSASFITASTMGVRLLRLLRRFTARQVPELPPSEDNLPTVSVCIPARDEMHAMTRCLEAVIASTYPKLEIIVLDDASKDNTSILIKSFAHSGVRFVEGSPLPDGWLGKTHAEHELIREASGDLILFLDVDTHIRPRTIDTLVALMLSENATMVSVMPTRDDVWRGSILFATLRYFWTIILHRPSLPAVASSAWLVRRDYLSTQFQNLETLRLTVEPERLIAAEAARHNAYRFYVSSHLIGVSYEKKWRSQLETSIRLLYPSLKGRLIQVAIAYITMGLMLVPFAWVPTAIILGWHTSHLVAAILSLLMIGVYTLYTTRVWRKGWLIGGVVFPFVLIQEIYLLTRSVYAYSTRTVTWKGRPIMGSAKAVMRPTKDAT